MNIASVASAYTYMKQTQLQSQIQTLVLQNAMDSQNRMLQELLQTSPTTAASANPPNLGNNINMYL